MSKLNNIGMLFYSLNTELSMGIMPPERPKELWEYKRGLNKLLRENIVSQRVSPKRGCRRNHNSHCEAFAHNSKRLFGEYPHESLMKRDYDNIFL